MSDTNFVYVNLNGYSVVVNGPFGGSFTIKHNKAVKGEYFARFAQPKGPLSMIPEHRIKPEAIVFNVKPMNEDVATAWAATKAKVNPTTTSEPPVAIAVAVVEEVVEVKAPIVSEVVTVAVPVAVEPDKQKRRGRKAS